ncbi:hypothetical protein JCM8547_005723 [Rhodosporidiobolus lusitaniae]
MELDSALQELTVTVTSTPTIHSLPDELVLLVYGFTLPPSPPPPYHPRRELDGSIECNRCRALGRISLVDLRFRRLASDFGELVVRVQYLPSVAKRDAPLHRLVLLVEDSLDFPDAPLDCLWRDLRVLTVVFTSRPDCAFDPSKLAIIGPLEALEELNIVDRSGSCVPVAVANKFLAIAPSLATLRLSHVDGGLRKPDNLRLVALQVATTGIREFFVLAHLLLNSPSLRHLHILEPSPLCAHGSRHDASRRYLDRLMLSFRHGLESFTLGLSETRVVDPQQHLLYRLLPHTPALARLDTSLYAFVDPILALLPSLPHLHYLRLVHPSDAPAAKQDPSFWTWSQLASQAVQLVQAAGRPSHMRLRIEVKCEGTLRKYDVAQKSCRAAFEEKAGGKKGLQGRLRVLLEYWPDRPLWQAWPV